MKYFYDTEFLEGTKKKWFKQSEPTIDLISIGIVAEDGREYYAVSKNFNLKEAWNRYDEVLNRHFPLGPEYNKVYWIRENVLRPIYSELLLWEYADKLHVKINSSEFLRLKEMKEQGEITIKYPHFDKCYKDFKRLINKYGKTNKQIAKDICSFIDARGKKENPNDWIYPSDGSSYPKKVFTKNVELYGYYSAYDHVALCWLFGKMIDLPKGFPMYTRDLKQSFDEKQAEWINKTERQRTKIALKNKDFSVEIDLKKSSNYPKQDNEHNALDDAKWNKELYEFLKTIN